MMSIPTAEIPQTTAGTTGCSMLFPGKKKPDVNKGHNIFDTLSAKL